MRDSKLKRYDQMQVLHEKGSFKHDVMTPMELVDEIIEKSRLIREAKILILYNIEFAVSILEDYRDIHAEDIYLLHDGDDTVTALCSKLGINPITMKELQLTMEDNMKFDLVIGNPPFSSHSEGKQAGKRGTELYIEFYRLALEISETVAMIMPTTDRKVQKKHNERLIETANVIEYIKDDVFKGISMPMWYVLSDNSRRKPKVEFSIFDKVGNDIDWQKGRVNMTAYKRLSGDHGKDKPSKRNSVTIYHKLNSKNGLIKKYGQKKHFKSHEFFPSKGYALLMPQTITDDGWSVTEIVKCTGNEVAFNGVNIVFTKTKREAKELVELMKTDKFKQQAIEVRQGFNNMNLSCLRAINL